MSEVHFDPTIKIPGYDITYGDVKDGGNCSGRCPRYFYLEPSHTGERYAETEEEYELYGPRLPETITKLVEVEVGCENYQALIAAGVAVNDCVRCPLRQTHLDS